MKILVLTHASAEVLFQWIIVSINLNNTKLNSVTLYINASFNALSLEVFGSFKGAKIHNMKENLQKINMTLIKTLGM
jgi:hypothetical protein